MTLILGGAEAPHKTWRAAMAWAPDAVRDNAGERCLLRRTFELAEAPDSFRVLVSADSRYRLFVNGERAGRGPLKGTLQRYHFEEYDIAPLLKAGRNVLAADVIWFGYNSPLAEEHSGFAGFLLQGPEGAGIDTPGEWRAWHARGAFEWDRTGYTSNAHLFLAGTERLDGYRFPAAWEHPEFDDSAWPAAALTVPLNGRGGDPDRDLVWNFAPRDIPALVEEPRRFVRTLEDMRPAAVHRFGDPPTGWDLPAGEGGEIVLDAGVQTTGFLSLAFEGGEGRTVEIVYGECVLQKIGDPNDASPYRWGARGRLTKGKRDDLEGSPVVHGYQDTVTLPGGSFDYEPHHWRTFWFVRIKVSAGDTPFRLIDCSYRFTTYPQERRSTFTSSEPDVEKILDVSWRTQQLCSHETYEDCPYYEQLNYLFDSRNEAMISMYLCGETGLPKRTIRLFRDTLRPDGMISSRTPSQLRQTIPIFALWWVQMLADLWEWAGPAEASFLTENLYTMDGVLAYFRNRLRADGFVGELPYWNPIGGEDAPGTDLDDAIKAGGSTYVTALYLTAVENAMRLHTAVGHPEDAARWQGTRGRLLAAVRSAWSPTRGVFVERLAEPDAPVSQHTQATAILCGAAEHENLGPLLASLEKGVPVAPMSRQQGLPYAEAMHMAGRYDIAARQFLAEYRMQLGLNLTTWLESGPNGRSDCHAWSAWAPVEFLRSILGVRPLRPGFSEVLIEPQPVFPDAAGTLATPAGEVRVSWQRGDGGAITSLQAEAPHGIPVTVRLPGREEERFRDGGVIRVS